VKYIPSCHCEVAKGSRGNLRTMEFIPGEKTEIASLTLAMTNLLMHIRTQTGEGPTRNDKIGVFQIS